MVLPLLILVACWFPSLGKRTDLGGVAVRLHRDDNPFDGFELFGPWSTSEAACSATGWKGKYTIMGGLVQILSVEVGPKTTTFEFNPELVSQAQGSEEDSLVAKWFRLQGPISNEKVAELFCEGPKVGSVSFRLKVQKACEFWSPTHLHSLCPALASEVSPSEPSSPEASEASEVAALAGSEASAPTVSDPFDGVSLQGHWVAGNNGCSAGGWSGRYRVPIAGLEITILKVDIDAQQDTTTFEWWETLAARAGRSQKENKLADWFRMKGPQPNAMLKDFFCGDDWGVDMKPSLSERVVALSTKACSFWSSSEWKNCPTV